MKILFLSFLILVGFVANSIEQTTTPWFDCGNTLAQRLVRFNTFSAFPSPVTSGTYLHIRSTVALNSPISAGEVQMIVTYQNDTANPLLFVDGIDLCNFTSSLNCPLLITNATIPISFDWLVPEFPPGDYNVNFRISTPGNQNVEGCLNFEISIDDPAITGNVFNSSYQANLVGTAIYERSPFATRVVGDFIQVGPIGPFPSGATFPWGTFSGVIGTADIIHPYFDPTNYVWGLGGSMNSSNTTNSVITQVYTGTFYVGYIGPFGTYATADSNLLTGTFLLNAIQDANGVQTLGGSINFDPADGVFPQGWFNPLSMGRLNPSTVSTDDTGQFVVTGFREYCISEPCNVAAPTPAPSGGNNLSSRDLGLIIGLILGVAFLIVVGVLLFIFISRRRRYSEEDGVFNLNRKPEYGSALVVDDIIQETKAHSGAALPILDHSGKAFPPAYLDDYPMPEFNRPPRRPRNRDRSRSRSPVRRRDRASTRPRSERGRPNYESESDSEPQLSNHSSSRSRSPRGNSRSASSRSRSLSNDSRSSGSLNGPGRGRRSRSRSGSSRSFSDNASDVSGSSRSRSRSRTPDSGSDGPRRR